MSFYFVFIKKEKNHFGRGRGRAAALMLPLISIAMGFAAYKEINAVNEISKYITPYNGKMSSIYTPMGNIWQFETSDTEEQVKLFYANKENHKGWHVVRGFPFMTLQKDNKLMRISINLMKKTSITYTLSEAKN